MAQQRRSHAQPAPGRSHRRAILAAAPLSQFAPRRRRHGRHDASRDYAAMVEETAVRTHIVEYRHTGRPEPRRAGGGGFGRRARRRPEPRLFVLRSRRRQAQPRHLHDPRPHPAGARRGLCRTSISAIGSRAPRRWTTRPNSGRLSCCWAASGAPTSRSSSDLIAQLATLWDRFLRCMAESKKAALARRRDRAGDAAVHAKAQSQLAVPRRRASRASPA